MICLLCAVLLPLAGCGHVSTPPEATDFPVTVGGVKIESAPQRVVSLSPSVTEVIYTLGSNAQLCGVSDDCDYPQGTASLPRLGTQIMPDIVKIIELDADLVICSVALLPADEERLTNQNIKVVVIPVSAHINVTEMYIQIASVLSGQITGRANAQVTAGRILAEINRITEIIGTPEVKACMILSGSGAIAGGDTFAGGLLTAAGVLNIAQEKSGFEMKPEEIADWNPEFIFCPSGHVEKFKNEPAFANTPAVINNRVIGIDVLLFERQGDRMVVAVKELAKHIAPEKAEEIDSATAAPEPTRPDEASSAE